MTRYYVDVGDDLAARSKEVDGEAIVEAVEEDTSLTPIEKETTILFSKVDDCASVYTEEAGLMRRLLCHSHFEVESLRGAEGRRVALSDFEGGTITGVDGTIPIEALVFQTSLRETSQHSAVVPEGVLRADRQSMSQLPHVKKN